MHARRLPGNPIVTPRTDDSLGNNVNGPSLIRVPDWVADPLGNYYLYFAHHKGDYIRLAYADDINGPWEVYEPGTISLADSRFHDHVASPDVHVCPDEESIWMYFHGEIDSGQQTRVATSPDGINFTEKPPLLGPYYFRVFEWDGQFYALTRDGAIHRSASPDSPFEQGPTLFPDMRHCAVHRSGPRLHVFYSEIGAKPERIVHSTIDLTPSWRDWDPTPAETVLEPEREYEGVKNSIHRSESGAVYEEVRQLRDPAIFVEDDETYLLYSTAGESGIAVATLEWEP